ncbi:MAG: DUF4142 domain-containing protein [Betaproteobacteria bacterium]
MAIPLLCLGVATAAERSGPLSRTDRDFIRHAAQAGMAEVDAAKLAKGKSDGQEVKDFARRMEEDHARANDELKQIAGAKGVELPHDVDRRHHRAMDKLRSHTAAQFDREYMDGQVSDHRDAVRRFEREARHGDDPDLRKWAADKLPALREHLQMAQAAAKGVRTEKQRASRQPGDEPSGSMKK